MGIRALLEFELSRSRSSKAFDLDVNRKRICDFLVLDISNFELISYRLVFRCLRYWRLKLENGLFSPTPPLFDAPARGRTRWDFWMKLMTQRHGATVCENFIILTSTVLTDPPVLQTDRQTDGRAIAYSALSMYMLYACTGVWRAKNLWLHTGHWTANFKSKRRPPKVTDKFHSSFQSFTELSCFTTCTWTRVAHSTPRITGQCVYLFRLLIINLWLHAGLSARSCRWTLNTEFIETHWQQNAE